MKRILLLATVLLIAVAGCSLPFDSPQTDSEQKPVVTEQDPQPTWTLTVRLSESNPEPGERVQVEYATNGYFSGTAYGIRILFLDENETVIKEVPAENISALGVKYSVNTTMPEPPFYVTAKMKGWDTPGMEPVAISGHFHKPDEVDPLYEITNKGEFIYNDSSG